VRAFYITISCIFAEIYYRMAVATVTQISPQGAYYANECVSITIESPANTGTKQYTTVYRLTFLRGDGATFISADQILTNGGTIRINLNEWAKQHLYHQVPIGNNTNNNTAYGWVGVSTKVNEYDTDDCTEIAGAFIKDIDPDSQDYTILSAYLQPDRQGSLVTAQTADFDTFRDVYVCRSGFTYINLFGNGRTIIGNAILENGNTANANFTTSSVWSITRIQRGVNGVPATATSVTYTLTGGRLITIHFCDCRCKDTDTRILFLEPMGAWTVIDFDETATIRAGQTNQQVLIDNNCRDLQYGGVTNAFADRGVSKLYQSKIGVKKSNIRGLSMIATASKVMQLDGSTWIKLQFDSQTLQIWEQDDMLTLTFTASYTIDGHRIER